MYMDEFLQISPSDLKKFHVSLPTYTRLTTLKLAFGSYDRPEDWQAPDLPHEIIMPQLVELELCLYGDWIYMWNFYATIQAPQLQALSVDFRSKALGLSRITDCLSRYPTTEKLTLTTAFDSPFLLSQVPPSLPRLRHLDVHSIEFSEEETEVSLASLSILHSLRLSTHTPYTTQYIKSLCSTLLQEDHFEKLDFGRVVNLPEETRKLLLDLRSAHPRRVNVV